MATLFELVAQSNSITQHLLENGGEISEELSKELESIGTDLAIKVDNYSTLLDRLDHEVDFWGSKADEIYRAKKSLDNLRTSIKNRIKDAMIMMNVTSIEGEHFKFNLQKAKKKTEIDEKILPDRYKKQIVTTEINKEMIEEELKEGFEIQGVKTEDSFYVKRYINKMK